jgi:hypothetical protein
LGISHTALAKKLEMSLANIGFSVVRGQSIEKAPIIHLMHELLNFERALPLGEHIEGVRNGQKDFGIYSL